MPDRWRQLPLAESPRTSLRIAVEILPFSLRKSAAVDDEVADFTQNGGWHKIDKLFPLLLSGSSIPASFCGGWIADLRRFTTNMKVSGVPLFGGSD